jgi:hypothetical protein
VLGLYLLHLLVEARLAELHCEVETLSAEDRAAPTIAFPLKLENYLMEGGYNKASGRHQQHAGGLWRCDGTAACPALLVRVPHLPHTPPETVQILAARASVPSEYYAPFMDSLTHTVRDDIAECASASYVTMSLPAAQKMFKFDSASELADYVAKKQVGSTGCMLVARGAGARSMGLGSIYEAETLFYHPLFALLLRAAHLDGRQRRHHVWCRRRRARPRRGGGSRAVD